MKLFGKNSFNFNLCVYATKIYCLRSSPFVRLKINKSPREDYVKKEVQQNKKVFLVINNNLFTTCPFNQIIIISLILRGDDINYIIRLII